MAEVHALDVGCGFGVHAQLLAEEGTRVTAFDGSPSAIDHGRVPHPHARIAYQVATLLELDPNTGPFDLVIDRLSSIHAGVSGVTAFYQSLRTALAPDARLFWQGFDIENSGRSFGHYDTSINVWTGFSEIFYSLREAQIIIESWRKHYNTERPHSALGYRPPAPEAIVPMDQGPIMH